MEAVELVVVGGRAGGRPEQLPRRATDGERLVDEDTPLTVVIRRVAGERVQTIVVGDSRTIVPISRGSAHGDEVVVFEEDAVVAITHHRSAGLLSGLGVGDSS